jgi:DNA sulfur modification protein DndD
LLEDRKQRDAAISGAGYLNLTDDGRNSLLTLNAVTLPDVKQRVVRLLQRADDLRAALEEADRRLAAVPAESAISGIIEERGRAQLAVEESQTQVRMLDNQLERVSRELEQKQAAHRALIEKSVEARFEEEDVARIIVHSQKVRKTLDVFRATVVERHVSRIAQLVLDSFRQLLRKRSLISELRIDPQSFALELRGMDGKILPPDRLSAGERQLLAVSMLWGLARASGRPLPAVIDTPLGRLDASHRSNLIERYFPNASHQVLLLSTDEEIDEKYYEKLKPWVGRSYLLEFDDSIGATRVKPGYFWQ